MRSILLSAVVLVAGVVVGCRGAGEATPRAGEERRDPDPATQPSTRPARTVKNDPVVNPIADARPMEQLRAAPLYTFNEKEVDAYLKALSREEPDLMGRVVHLARKNLGQPYEIYLLGEGPFETYDPDPMYCLSKSDCVTFVEHTYAMALSDGWPGFFRTLQKLRYKDGQVGMVTRNHESVADWTPNNAWLFEDVTGRLGDGKQTVPMRMTWRPAKFFEKYGIGQEMPDVKIESAYIPKENVANVLSSLKAGDVVQIVRGDPKGQQWVGHFGLVTPGADVGSPNLLHSAEPAVKEQSLMEYVHAPKGKTIGIRVLRVRGDRVAGAGL